MQSKVLATLAYEAGQVIGDTSTSFLTRIKIFLNDRYSDSYMRSGATTWTSASMATLGDTDIPIIGLGEVIKDGAVSDAYVAKKQFTKAAAYEQKYNFKLGNFIISQPYTRFNISMARYEYHEE